ncbi:adenylosuccinate lyase family protein [Leuconostoc rapi]|uniref:class-II fumarase/aspartase family protein n=1 Tax=Leuconostoc rapi TaxID=1406906 RepID=UPI00195B88CA|nr:adenylosuccinate lyase family protein [Leuconostoc rapi]MBM7434838.1 adenylosuccinate lyase [Leuconostoc rapi]
MATLNNGSHPIDYAVTGGNFGTADMRDIWSEKNRLKQQFVIEQALAKVEGEEKVIPQLAAEAIDKIKFEDINFDNVITVSHAKQHSLLGLIQELQRLAGHNGEFIHYGATTQDIVDTGLVLQIRSSIELIELRLEKIIATLTQLTKKYAQTPYMAHTHGVQAVPITLGFKFARYVDEFKRHLQRLEQTKSDVLTGNFAGAVGSHSALGEQGLVIEHRLLDELQLNTPKVAWHTAPDRIVNYTSILTLIGATAGKLGKELFHAAGNEINEITEPFLGQVGSSTMPHKRNPENFEGIWALVEPIFQSQNLLQHSLLSLGERDASSWKILWLALPEIHNYLDVQLNTLVNILPNIEIHTKKIAENAAILGPLVYAEKLMIDLGKTIGKQTAHEVIYEAAMATLSQPEKFLQRIADNSLVNLSETELETIVAQQDVTIAIPTIIQNILGEKI